MQAVISPRTWAPTAALALTLALALQPTRTEAHNPQVATFVLRQEAAGWWVQVHAPQIAFEASLRAEAPDRDLRTLGIPGLKAAIVRYAKAHLSLVALPSAQEVGVDSAGIRLGHHETRLRLLLEPLPAGTTALRVRIDAFTEDGAQSNVVRTLPLQGKGRSVVLGDGNGYQAEIALPPAPAPAIAARRSSRSGPRARRDRPPAARGRPPGPAAAPAPAPGQTSPTGRSRR